MTPDERLVAFAVAQQQEPLTPEVGAKAIHLLLDAISLARMATRHPVVEAVRSLHRESREPCSRWTDAGSLAAADAALENGTAVHAHFHDDTDMSAWAHPASVIVPAVVAAAENDGLGLDHVLRGLVSGYAALSWLAAREEVSRLLVERGQRAGPTLGSIAAAVGASTTLGLGRTQTLHALGIATDSTGGLLEPVRDGAQDWRLQNGFAAQRGLVAALLARGGIRGPSRPLTAEKGLLASLGRESPGEIPAQWGEDPDPRSLLNVWFKPYPTLGDNMAPAVAAALLYGRVAPEEIDAVEIAMNAHFAAYPGTAFRGPFERTEQAIASTAFAVASLLVAGDLAYADYDRLLDDVAVARLVSLTTIVAREDFGYLDGTVRVTSKSTSVEASSRDAPRETFFRDLAVTSETLARRGHHDLALTAQLLLGGADDPHHLDVSSLVGWCDASGVD